MYIDIKISIDKTLWTYNISVCREEQVWIKLEGIKDNPVLPSPSQNTASAVQKEEKSTIVQKVDPWTKAGSGQNQPKKNKKRKKKNKASAQSNNVTSNAQVSKEPLTTINPQGPVTNSKNKFGMPAKAEIANNGCAKNPSSGSGTSTVKSTASQKTVPSAAAAKPGSKRPAVGPVIQPPPYAKKPFLVDSGAWNTIECMQGSLPEDPFENGIDMAGGSKQKKNNRYKLQTFGNHKKWVKISKTGNVGHQNQNRSISNNIQPLISSPRKPFQSASTRSEETVTNTLMNMSTESEKRRVQPIGRGDGRRQPMEGGKGSHARSYQPIGNERARRRDLTEQKQQEHKSQGPVHHINPLVTGAEQRDRVPKPTIVGGTGPNESWGIDLRGQKKPQEITRGPQVEEVLTTRQE